MDRPGRPVAVAIRAGVPGDCTALTRIAHAAKGRWGYPPELLRLWREDLTVTPGRLAEEDTRCAVLDGEIVGFYSVSDADGAVYELEGMWVLPAFSGLGIGSRLFEHAIELLRAKGAAVLRIASDPNAVGFYRRMGARQAGERPSSPPGRVLPLLERKLR